MTTHYEHSMTIQEKIKSSLFSNEKTVIAITGLSKNAGKTSLLNWLMLNFPNYNYGITTTGRDGEEQDVVYGTTKPKVKVNKGTIFSTFASEIGKNSHLFTILEKTELTASGKKLWIVQALTDVDVEIVGPATVLDQQKIIEKLQFHGASTILIDGSLDRKAIVLNSKIDSIVVVAGANYGDNKSIIRELKRLDILNSIHVSDEIIEEPEYILLKTDKWVSTELKSLLGNESKFLQLCKASKIRSIYLPGAITSKSWSKIGGYLTEFGGSVIVKHPFNLQINEVYLELLSEEVQLETLHRFKINVLAVNSNSLQGNHLDSQKLLDDIREFFPELPVIDTMGIE